MVVGVFAALMSAACYGIAAVLQARAARATAGTATVDPRLVIRLGGQAQFLGGMLLGRPHRLGFTLVAASGFTLVLAGSGAGRYTCRLSTAT
jgi:hypothetical protein